MKNREFHHLLLALDSSDCSAQALREAIALAASTGAQLTLLHVLQPWSYVQDLGSAVSALNEAQPLMRQAGELLLAQAGAQALARGVSAQAVLWMPQGQGAGRLWEVVDEQARLCGADLIVMGSHGRKGLGRALLGSDAEQILRHARLPVLVVKGRARD